MEERGHYDLVGSFGQIGTFAKKYLGDIIKSKLGSSKPPSAKRNCRTKTSDFSEVSFGRPQGVQGRLVYV